jgi:uncharacterized protein (DUF2235 family)
MTQEPVAKKPTSKKIVLLLDGTSNEIEAQRTNILRLYGCLEKSDTQLVYYDPGVGTISERNYWSRRQQKLSEVWGMATGRGIDENVKEAYRFLVENYQGRGAADEGRDQIYVFGFSRGAYTARMLAGFIYTIGLLEPRNLNLVDYAYRAYKRIGNKAGEGAFSEVGLYQRILQADRPPVEFLGLFDTVASVIEPRGRGFLRLKSHAYTARNPGVKIVRHAAALHERRRMFNVQPWREGQRFHMDPLDKDSNERQDAKEVWFTGWHGDIGGGEPEEESGLAKIALQWMLEEAGQWDPTTKTGLEINQNLVNLLVLGTAPADKPRSKPDAHARLHKSMNALWWLVEYLPLPFKQAGKGVWRITACQRRKVPSGALIHASVLARAEKDGGKLPANVPEKRGVEGEVSHWL